MKTLLLSCFFALCLCACKTDKVSAEDSLSSLVGKWDIYKVYRNKKLTKSLDGGYFTFKNDKTIESNIFTNSESYAFQCVDDRLSMDNDEHIKELRILSIEDDTLTMTSKVMSFDMKFFLTKSTE